jgi:hypothetical protein
MNRLVLLLPLALAPLWGQAQAPAPELPLDPVTHRITYLGVVPVPEARSAQLYARAVDWIANDSNPQVFAAQLYDAAQGKITVREVLPIYAGTLATPTYVYAHVQYTLTVYVKEGRYKYVISHLEYINSTAPYAQQPLESAVISGMFDKQWRALKVDAAQQLQGVLARLQASMSTVHRDAADF